MFQNAKWYSIEYSIILYLAKQQIGKVFEKSVRETIKKIVLGKSIYQKQKTIKSHFINKLQDPNTSKHTSNFKKKIHVLRTP